MKNRNKILILDEDLQCLKWLWRWKLLTTHALKLGVYQSKNLNRTYRRLMQLENQKHIQTYCSRDGKYCLWQLADKGFVLLKNNYPEQFVAGYKTENPNHDFWVSAIHLGDWIREKPKEGLWYSEQELRRNDTDDFPKWVPHLKSNRPDGYWKINSNLENDAALVALEVELSKKDPLRYNSIGEFYNEKILIYQVIWIVKSEGEIKYIFKHLMKDTKETVHGHGFTTIDQFIQYGWQSKIIFGKNCGKTISEILEPRRVPGTTHSTTLGLLDLRKKPVESKTHKPIAGADLGLNRHIVKSKDYSTPEYHEPGASHDD